MGWNAISAVADLLGAAAVFMTLLYLTRQIKQTNIISRFNADSELLARFDDLNRLIVTDAGTRRELSNKGPLTTDEQEHLYARADSLCNTHVSAESACKAGLIDERISGAITHDLEIALQRWPMIRDRIKVWLDCYPFARSFRIFEPLCQHSGQD